MKYNPILFRTDMVNSILQRNKTCTRRMTGLDEINEYPDDWEFVRFYDGYAKFCRKNNWVEERYIKCRYGNVGDRLWVRETWAKCHSGYVYKADDYATPIRWKPPIHMPKEASRIILEINKIGFERLQSISEKDAINEGIQKVSNHNQWFNYMLPKDAVPAQMWIRGPINSFKTLWVKINGQESWDANPWVVVIGFDVV